MSEPPLSEVERTDPFAPHDPGCHCWPHVSQRAAIEAAVQAGTAEYRAARAKPGASEGLRAARDIVAATSLGRHGSGRDFDLWVKGFADALERAIEGIDAALAAESSEPR